MNAPCGALKRPSRSAPAEAARLGAAPQQHDSSATPRTLAPQPPQRMCDEEAAASASRPEEAAAREGASRGAGMSGRTWYMRMKARSMRSFHLEGRQRALGALPAA